MFAAESKDHAQLNQRVEKEKTSPAGGGAELVPADYFREIGLGELFPERMGLPLELDLGCGDGRFLLELAATFPERNFLGIERVKGRVHHVAGAIRRSGLDNLRVLRLDIAYVIGWLLPPACVQRVHFLFPDPWPKKRHHKNRMPRDLDFLRGLGRVLEPGGEILHKTDQRDYFEELSASFSELPGLQEMDWDEHLVGEYPETDFERQWVSMQRPIYRCRWCWSPR